MSADARSPVVQVLDVQPELGADLDDVTFAEAHRLLGVPALDLDPGAWDPVTAAATPDVRGRAFACLVVDGLLVRHLTLAGRVSTTLFGPGDAIGLGAPPQAALPAEVHHSVAVPTRVAVLDDRFLAAARRWPRIVGRLVDLTTAQVDRALVHRGVAQLPRVEARLLALFWFLAERWGHVGLDGVAVDLPLTHEALGRLIGARRPTVSLGLQALAERGQLQRRGDGSFLLSLDSIEALASDEDAVDLLRSVIAGRVGARRPAAALEAGTVSG